ncbi:MAG: hypothetical protein KF912_03860 [Phycisphaeraceae bacterium]|nr:hypothetical protein [Phycisphaeraceae bacterium]MBX3366432.1 hypothetical protein [Phycisphaeraceae bacterium]
MACSLASALIISNAAAQPVGNGFTYQGELRNAGIVANGTYDLRFRLYDALASGAQVGPSLCVDNVPIADGTFTVELDFGSVFAGSTRYLEIDVREDTGLGCASGTGFVTLAPRQRIATTPYAAYALTAASATTATSAASATTALSAGNSTNLNGQPASFYTNATNLTAGTLPDARLSSNVTTLSGTQTFSGAKSFSSSPSFTAAGSPFSVTSSTKVTNLNADLLDGLDSGAFAAASHAHDASAIVSGTLGDARIPSSVPRVGITNVFSDTQVVNVPSQTPLTLIGSNTGGTWVNLQNTGGGRTWNMIATGTTNGEGPGRLMIRDQTSNAVRMAIDSSGRVGIGTTSPTSLLEISQADAAMRIRNTNDPGGGFIQDTFSTLQIGMYNPTASAWGAVPANGTRAMLGVQNTGRVGTLTNTSGSPVWRNTIDDGSGNATFQGNLAANNTPRIKHFSGSEFLGVITNDSRTLIENITVTIPASGFLHIHCHSVLDVYTTTPTPSTVFLELKETTGGTEVLLRESPLRLSPPLSGPDAAIESSQVINHVIPVDAGTRSFKVRVRHSGGAGGGGGTLRGADITITYYPSGL